MVCIAVFLLLGITAGSGAVTAAPESTVNVTSIPVEPIQPGETLTFDMSMTNTDDKNIIVNERQTEVARFDADNDGIYRGDAVRAVVAYNTGSDVGGTKVTRQEAVRVIIAYITGQ